MSYQRIMFNSSPTSVGAYTLPVNPVHPELNDSSYQNVAVPLDGGGIIQENSFDNRPVVLTWTHIPANFGHGFATMMNTLVGYKGTVKYVNYGTADYRATPTTWNKVLVADVAVAVETGGRIRRNITVTLLPQVV